jgi:hypothetical protein
VHASSFVDRLAEARIGVTFNQYTDAWQLRERLAAYLEARKGAAFLLVGEAAGYRGARRRRPRLPRRAGAASA